MADSELVALSTGVDLWTMPSTSRASDSLVPSSSTRNNTSSQENETGSFSFIRKELHSQGIPEDAAKLIIKSWRSSTQKQYEPYIKSWLLYCRGKENPLAPNINHVLKFLTELFHKGVSYSTMGTARSAISTFLKLCGHMDINKFECVGRFMKGIFNERPALPKYNTIWDVKAVLDYLQSIQNSTLFQLACKVTVLFLLLSAQRCQTLHLIQLEDIVLLERQVIIHPNKVLKQTRPGAHLEPIILESYPKNEKLCIVKALHEYLHRTKDLRNSNALMISTIKPHEGASRSTISRWVKQVLLKAGVEKSFTSHSTRAASTSAARLRGVCLQTIIRTAGWSNARTFARFYNKPVVESAKSVQLAVLESI